MTRICLMKMPNGWVLKRSILLNCLVGLILSPFTHVRNFLSATALAAANGAILPSLTDIQTLAPKALGGKGVLGDAYKLTAGRVFGTLPEEQAAPELMAKPSISKDITAI